jgi:HEAT repeat protein
VGSVREDPATERPSPSLTDAQKVAVDEVLRRRRAVIAGHETDEPGARSLIADADAAVRAGALGALGRIGKATVADVRAALTDRDSLVRRRGCEVAAGLGGKGSRSTLVTLLVERLGDSDPLVVEAACFALGERRSRVAVGPLSALSAEHPDARCREAAVATLGAIGDPGALPALLARLEDKAPIRRRAVVALAAFSGDEVESALRRCLDDRDWQVRQAAEILLEG